MSANIRGITFAEQTVTPADDAIVRRAILSDGILSGCSITYSGSTLTLAAGYMIACGRIFQITAARNWAVVDATSGVARLVLTIDLTKTATESAFDQISFGIEYAAVEDGFVNLTQDDINVAGTRYQVTVAVVSLGAGGITGIISKLEKAEGGGGLNFKVVAGLTQPGSATENTIWVMTEKIGAYYFSATQPEDMQEWDVWFSTGTSSEVSFNALKKNAIEVYPLSAKQMVGGVLTDVTAKSYQNGAWVDWWDQATLYDSGDEFTAGTGGWVGVGMAWDNSQFTQTQVPDIARNANNMHMAQMNNNAGGAVCTKNKIDLTQFNTLSFTGKMEYTNNIPSRVRLCVWTELGSYVASGLVGSVEGAVDGTKELDVSALSGSYYIGFFMFATGSYVTMERLKLY